MFQQTTFDKLKDTIAELMPKLMATMKDKHIPATGAVVFIYHGLGPDQTQPFTLDMGQFVAAETAAAGDCQAAELEAFHCATMLCTGPVQAIGMTFEKLMPAIFDKHLTPTDEAREYYLYREGPDSANNVVQVQVGLK